MDPSQKEWEQYEKPQESVLCKRVVDVMRKGISPEEVAKLYGEWAEDMNYEKVSDVADSSSVEENNVGVSGDDIEVVISVNVLRMVVVISVVVLLMVVLITMKTTRTIKTTLSMAIITMTM